MPVNSTLLQGYKRDLEKVEAQGKVEFDQLEMGYHIKDVAPVGSQVDLAATGTDEGVVTVFTSHFQLTTQQNWTMVVEGRRFPKMTSAVPKGSDAGKPKYWERYTVFANKGKGDRMRHIGTLKCELLYTDEATGLETAAGVEYLPITFTNGRFENLAGGHVKITYKEDGSREMVATAAMNKEDRDEHGHPYPPLRRLPPKAARFAKDRE